MIKKTDETNFSISSETKNISINPLDKYLEKIIRENYKQLYTLRWNGLIAQKSQIIIIHIIWNIRWIAP